MPVATAFHSRVFARLVGEVLAAMQQLAGDGMTMVVRHP
jgi:ABC-type histidine transport system ATPase subunit